jgi:sodium/bile acid cotransporter 7
LSYGLLPGAAWLAAGLATAPDLGFGLFLIACAPCTLGSAVLWTRMGGGNEATALLTIFLTTSTSWLFTNAWLSLSAGSSLAAAQSMQIMVVLLVSLVVPVGLGQACRAVPVLVRFAEHRRAAIDVLAQLLILSIIIKAAAQVGQRLHGGSARLDAGMALWTAGACAALHLLALATGFWTSRLFGWDRARQVAVAFAGSQKSLPVALLLFDRYFKEEMPLAIVPLLFYHVGQLILDTPLARRFNRRVDV